MLTFVIPVYDEEENLLALYNELIDVINTLERNYEIIFIDDGSKDKSLTIIKNLTLKNKNIKYISFEHNVGQSGALYAGFTYAKGDIVITMDADLQNDPHDLIKMLDFYGEYDMITGWRYNRQDNLWKKIGSFIGNTVRNTITDENIHDTGCSLKIMKASLLKKIKMFKGLHRFLPTLMKLEGANVLEFKVNHRPRQKGKSKYGNFKRAIEGLYDVFVVRWMKKRYLHIKIKETNV